MWDSFNELEKILVVLSVIIILAVILHHLRKVNKNFDIQDEQQEDNEDDAENFPGEILIITPPLTSLEWADARDQAKE